MVVVALSRGSRSKEDDSSSIMTLFIVGASLAGAVAFAKYHKNKNW